MPHVVRAAWPPEPYAPPLSPQQHSEGIARENRGLWMVSGPNSRRPSPIARPTSDDTHHARSRPRLRPSAQRLTRGHHAAGRRARRSTARRRPGPRVRPRHREYDPTQLFQSRWSDARRSERTDQEPAEARCPRRGRRSPAELNPSGAARPQAEVRRSRGGEAAGPRFRVG